MPYPLDSLRQASSCFLLHGTRSKDTARRSRSIQNTISATIPSVGEAKLALGTPATAGKVGSFQNGSLVARHGRSRGFLSEHTISTFQLILTQVIFCAAHSRSSDNEGSEKVDIKLFADLLGLIEAIDSEHCSPKVPTDVLEFPSLKKPWEAIAQFKRQFESKQKVVCSID